ncbi:hypothetical protein D917_06372 [Trichinella nativa]|uniref:Uncharacterized protein n=1 Tax=Trichinella nativa TaxID=6335 RepID=A0A1Y3ESK6_9BILA|nr:hypothetical protein D917_06372 [Trichinella nativa]
MLAQLKVSFALIFVNSNIRNSYGQLPMHSVAMRDKLLVWNIFHVRNKLFLYKGSGYLYGPETVLRRICEVDLGLEMASKFADLCCITASIAIRKIRLHLADIESEKKNQWP